MYHGRVVLVVAAGVYDDGMLVFVGLVFLVLLSSSWSPLCLLLFFFSVFASVVFVSCSCFVSGFVGLTLVPTVPDGHHCGLQVEPLAIAPYACNSRQLAGFVARFSALMIRMHH